MFMSATSNDAARPARILAELSELGLTLARELHARALATETPEQASALAGAFHRISRSVRQSLALEARLDRDRRVEARDALRNRDGYEPGEQAAAARRKDELRAAMEPRIWNEREGEERDYLLDLLEDRLDHFGRKPGFADPPLDVHIADLCADFGLDLPGEEDGEDEDPDEAEPDEADRDGAHAPLAHAGQAPRDSPA